VGVGQVGLPTGVVGNGRISLFRLISGFMLVAIGVSTILIGMASSCASADAPPDSNHYLTPCA
jgi:hypothetical protein